MSLSYLELHKIIRHMVLISISLIPSLMNFATVYAESMESHKPKHYVDWEFVEVKAKAMIQNS